MAGEFRHPEMDSSTGSRCKAAVEKGGDDDDDDEADDITWSTATPSNGTPTDEDIGDVWDEDGPSFIEDEVEGFEDEDEPIITANIGHHNEEATTEAPQTTTTTECSGGQNAVANLWNLEDIPEEEATDELLAVITAAEEYLSSAGSAAAAAAVVDDPAGRIRADDDNDARNSNFHENAEDAVAVKDDAETVATNASIQRKQSHPENSTKATSSLDLQSPPVITRASPAPRPVVVSDREESPPMNVPPSTDSSRSMTSPPKRIFASSASTALPVAVASADAAAPQLNIFSVADTKFPDSPCNSRRETISQSSQSSSRLSSIRSSKDRAKLGGVTSKNDRFDHRFPKLAAKLTKPSFRDQLSNTGTSCRPAAKFRGSPPPPIPDFRPGSPPDDDGDQSASVTANDDCDDEETQSQLPSASLSSSAKHLSLDTACLSKLTNDIERLLAQLDSDLPEEKARCRAILRDREKRENAEFKIDARDFRKCYCSVQEQQAKAAVVASSTMAERVLFPSPSSDGEDSSIFYSGDDGKASLISDNSITATTRVVDISASLCNNNASIDIRHDDDQENHALFTLRTKREMADPLTVSIAKRSRTADYCGDQAQKSNTPPPPSKEIDKFTPNRPSFVSKYRFLKTDTVLGYRFTPAAEKDGSTRFRYTSYAAASTRLQPSITTSVISRSPSRTTNSQYSSYDSDRLFPASSSSSSEGGDENAKMLQERIRNLEKLLSQERDLRNSAEQREDNLRTRIEQIELKLDQTEKQAATSAESDAKKERDLNHLRAEAEKVRRNHQTALDSLRKEHATAMASIEDQLNGLRLQERNRAQRECAKLRERLDEAQSAADSLSEEKRSLETERNQLELKSYEYSLTVDQLQNAFTQAVESRRKTRAESGNLENQVREYQERIAEVDKKCAELQRQIDSLTSNLKEEIDHRNALAQTIKQLEKENQSLREINIREEENKKDLNRQLNRANSEILSLQTKLEQCSLAQAELLEQQKNYFTNKLNQARQENETLSSRVTFLERIRNQLRKEIDELSVDLKQADVAASCYDKRVAILEKTIREWEERYNELAGKVTTLEGELREATNELQRSKRQMEEALEEAAALRRENKNLKEETIQTQQRVYELTEALMDAERVKKRLIEEKEKAESALKGVDTETRRVERLLAKGSAAGTSGSGGGLRNAVNGQIREQLQELEQDRRSLQSELEALTATMDAEKRAKDAAVAQCELMEKKTGGFERALAEANKARGDAFERAKRLDQRNEVFVGVFLEVGILGHKSRLSCTARI